MREFQMLFDFGGGGGGGGGNTTVTNTNIPEYLQAPTERLIARGEALTGPGAQYQQYGGERVAGFSPLQEQAFSGISAMGTPGQYGQAQGSLSNAQNIANAAALQGASYQPGSFQAASYDPAQASAMGYNAATVNLNDPRFMGGASSASAADKILTTQFGQSDADRYMSPYQQAVTDVAKQRAALEGQQMMNQLGAKAALNNSFGGSRFGLEQAQGMRDIGSNLSNIQTTGSQKAYENAQAQFNADMLRRLQADTSNSANQQSANNLNAQLGTQASLFNAGQGMQGALANMGSLNQAGMFGANAGNTAALANMGAQNAASQFGGQNWMDAQRMAEQSRQFGSDAGLRGADLAARTGLSAADQYRALGNDTQRSELDRLNALGAAGNQQQGLAQRYADVGYGNFMDARDFDKNNLTFMSGLLRGSPQGGGTSTTTAPSPSLASQIGGLGLGALGAWKMFGD